MYQDTGGLKKVLGIFKCLGLFCILHVATSPEALAVWVAVIYTVLLIHGKIL